MLKRLLLELGATFGGQRAPSEIASECSAALASGSDPANGHLLAVARTTIYGGGLILEVAAMLGCLLAIHLVKVIAPRVAVKGLAGTGLVQRVAARVALAVFPIRPSVAASRKMST